MRSLFLSLVLSSLPLPPLLSFSPSRSLALYPAINISRSPKSLSLSLCRHPLLLSSFIPLARWSFSSVTPFPLSSLFFRHPSHFSRLSLLSPPFFIYRARRRALHAWYSSRSGERGKKGEERERERSKIIFFAGLTCALTRAI